MGGLSRSTIEIEKALDKAETSVQSITINGETKEPNENGVVDLGNIEGGEVYISTLVYKANSPVPTANTWTDSTFGVPIIKHQFSGGTGVIYFKGRITTIGDRAFENCISLISITIPDSVITIGYGAFAYCRSLTSITIPDSVRTINGATFTGCISLTSVYCKSTTPPVGSTMFNNNASGRKIYVPMESVETYKSTRGWNQYADAIVGYHYNVGLFKTINGESIVGEGNIAIEKMTNISWSDLVRTRNNGELVPGTYYRITDYVTTTVQENTSSAGNPFDVIILALGKHTLSEEAYAIQSERDTDGYFANSNLSAWKLWYCLDNDTTRFAWADETNGTGVIYRMIDEFENDCPYDFKNILFIRYELEAPDEYSAQEDAYKWLEQLSKNVRAMFDEGVASYRWAGIELGDRYWEDELGTIYSVATTERKRFYTFSDITDYEDKEITRDVSLSFNCHGNKMGVAKDDVMYLPNNVFFGNDCYSNSLGDNCCCNSFGDGFIRNIFGERCEYNSFGDYCNYNSLGNSCSYNNFNQYCYDNSFGNQLFSSSFGVNCYSNSIGKNCGCNVFGNNCIYNSYGSNCFYNSLVGNNYKHNTFGDGVGYLHLLNDEQDQYDYNVQNYRIANGTQGTFEEPLVINAERGRNYETTVARTSNGDIVQFCLADIQI